jgi:FtsP/CotA-like multicopper oxidase with cupredoxin domain
MVRFMNRPKMPATHRLLPAIFFLITASLVSFGQTQMCPTRPVPGSVVSDPLLLTSQNGALTLNLTMVNSPDASGIMEYCYLYGDGSTEAPTLMVNPGDVLTINLTNHLTANTQADATPEFHIMSAAAGVFGPCLGGSMTSTSTNIHFHGLNIPPVCHQDDVIRTSIAANSPPFQYKIQIPANEPPGLYWYHPHPHGNTKTQVIGGASGALIVGGEEKFAPEISNLPQRVFVIRQQLTPGGSDESSILSINFVPYHENLFGRILTKPGEKQLWRLLNSSSTQFLQLQLLSQGVPANFDIVGLDGVPLEATRVANTVVIPPAGRADIVLQGPPKNGLYQLFNAGYDTGPIGDPNPAVLLADVVPSESGADRVTRVPVATKTDTLQRFAGLTDAKVTAQRKLYFSENTAGTKFFITVDGQTPRLYDPSEPPAIVTQQGAIEDWTLENHTQEVHAFHLHQLHFVVLEINGVPTHDSAVRDTIVVPYWTGQGPYTSVKVRVDFRDPETVGTFLYHCHILDHEDLGMMAKIEVTPAN